MRFFTILTWIFVFLPTVVAQSENSSILWPEIKNEAKPYTRWWWMGSAVDTANISWNLSEIANVGIGGVEITPIYGVKGIENKYIPFLSPEWMNMLSHTFRKSEQLGLSVEITNGTGWPFGGPNVNQENAASKLILQTFDATEGQYFDKRILPADAEQQRVAKLQIVMAYSNLGKTVNITSKVTPDGKLNWMPSEGKWKIIVAYSGKTQQKVKRAAPGGEGFVFDHFSDKAFDNYIQRFNDAFSLSNAKVPKVFFNDSYEVYNADWSPELFKEFKIRKGYNLEDYLNVFAGLGTQDEVARIKSDYREVLSGMLLNNFTERWVNWVHTKGAVARNQAHGSPGNIIDLYAAVDIPECESFGTTMYDIIGLRKDTGHIRSTYADPLMMKFASSAAHIGGKKYVSAESFTWLGEHFRVSLSQCKPQLDDLFTSGVNHVYFHGTAYSPKEAVWPGWQFYASVDFSSRNTFWCDISAMNSYISRCQSFLQMGQADNDFLLYFPIYDIWYNEKGTEIPLAIENMGQWLQSSTFYKSAKQLTDKGYSFDYISDMFVNKALVENGKVTAGGNGYKAIIVPMCRFIPYETLKALIDLARNGATVLFVEMPSEVPGLVDVQNKNQEFQKLIQNLALIPYESKDKLTTFGNGKMAIGGSLEKLINYLSLPHEGISDFKVKYIRRKNSRGYHYFMANLQAKPLDAWITLGVAAKSVVLFDPVTGNNGTALTRIKDGRLQVYLQLNSGESVILQTYTADKISGNNWEYKQIAGNAIKLQGSWNLSFTKGEPKIDSSFNLSGLQSWTELPDTNLCRFAGTGKYKLEFIMPEINAGNWELQLGEVHESARVTINGNKVATLWSIPFNVKVGQYLKPGKNKIEIEVTNINANRIADYDRRKVAWKVFNDINFVDVNYNPFDAAKWEPLASGLSGPVQLIPLK